MDMRRRHNYVWVIAVTAIFFCAAMSDAQRSKDELHIVLSGFPGYHLMTLQERNLDARTFILRHFPKNNPSVVYADFNGDGHPDYALLIRDIKSTSTKLVVLLCSKEVRCKSVYELDVTAYSGQVYIRPQPTGSRVSQTEAIETMDHPSPVRLTSPGIEVTYFGQAKVVLYWNAKHKRIEEVQTED